MAQHADHNRVDPEWVASIAREVIARLRGMSAATSEPAPALSDRNDPHRAAAVRQQLQRRGVALAAAKVILTDAPARETFEQIRGGQRAATITTINDVERFAAELSPDTWILDMQRLNLPAATNVVARIARLEDSRS